jgi:hypothetical protein
MVNTVYTWASTRICWFTRRFGGTMAKRKFNYTTLNRTTGFQHEIQNPVPNHWVKMRYMDKTSPDDWGSEITDISGAIKAYFKFFISHLNTFFFYR